MLQHLGTCCGGAIWFSPEKANTVHHVGSSMILTVEGTFCPSSGKLYNFDRSGHVLSIICGRDGELYGFDLRRHVLSAIWGRTGELYGFDLRGQALFTIWRDGLVSSVVLTWEVTSCPSSGELYGLVPERTPPIHHLDAEELYGFDPKGHVLSTIWWRAGELYGARHRRSNHYPVRAILMFTF